MKIKYIEINIFMLLKSLLTIKKKNNKLEIEKIIDFDDHLEDIQLNWLDISDS